ncbi:hypothetical protein Lepto7375DRAFT_5966 [Leptolyngbya sp. PCC 7375]|nr:hypothetical protein Lepto7375DRAFT_5966 [Leptolyngbya sp. PCC 7375]
MPTIDTELAIDLLDYFGTIEGQLRSYSDFHSSLEEYLNSRDRELDREMETKLEKFPRTYHSEIIEDRASEDFHFESKYKSIHRGSLVVIIYGFFEYQLNEFCLLLTKILKNKETFEDFKNSNKDRGFKLCCSYLEKMDCFNLTRIEKQIKYIQDINLFRNIVTHNGSVLISENIKDSKRKRKEAKRRIRFVSDNDYLDGEPDKVVFIHSEFIDELLGYLVVFFKEIEKEVLNYVNENDCFLH